MLHDSLKHLQVRINSDQCSEKIKQRLFDSLSEDQKEMLSLCIINTEDAFSIPIEDRSQNTIDDVSIKINLSLGLRGYK